MTDTDQTESTPTQTLEETPTRSETPTESGTPIETTTEEIDPKSPEEIRECLPEYDDLPEDEDERRERADEIYQRMPDCLRGHEWYGRVAQRYDSEHDEWYVTVEVHEREPTEEHVPGTWGGISIKIRMFREVEPE